MNKNNYIELAYSNEISKTIWNLKIKKKWG